MALTGLNTYVAGATLTAAQLNADNTVIAAKFNAAITTADLNASAGITNAQLANDDYEIVLSLCLSGTELLLDTNTYYIIGGVPYDATGGTGYTVLGIEHVLVLDQAGGHAAITSAVYDLHYGNPTDGWTAVKSGITVGTAATQTRETGFTTTYTLSADRPMFFRLDQTTAGVNYLNGDSWGISIKLKRTAGLRA